MQAPKTHWRQKHEEFVRNIRAAKTAQVAIERGDPLPPPPPPSENPGKKNDYISLFQKKKESLHRVFIRENKTCWFINILQKINSYFR